MSDKEPVFRHGTIRMHGFGPDGYTFPDPTSEAYDEARHAARYGSPTRDQLFALASAADALAHLMLHPCGTKYTTGQLRELRRALRKAGKL